jgi:succinate-semialdehyde dehydrogenase / glutarate-semialdehyde dehydrogenase
MKLSHFEMGSNDAFIVMEDSDVDKAVVAAYKSRMANSGQAVINAKRFLIHEAVYEEFRTKLISRIERVTVVGDPMDLATNVGPLGR